MTQVPSIENGHYSAGGNPHGGGSHGSGNRGQTIIYGGFPPIGYLDYGAYPAIINAAKNGNNGSNGAVRAAMDRASYYYQTAFKTKKPADINMAVNALNEAISLSRRNKSEPVGLAELAQKIHNLSSSYKYNAKSSADGSTDDNSSSTGSKAMLYKVAIGLATIFAVVYVISFAWKEGTLQG